MYPYYHTDCRLFRMGICGRHSNNKTCRTSAT